MDHADHHGNTTTLLEHRQLPGHDYVTCFRYITLCVVMLCLQAVKV